MYVLTGALLAERWDLGTVLKKKVTRMNVFTPDSNRELQQEIQQFIADRKLDKDIANKCRFVANRREGLHYAKNFGHGKYSLYTTNVTGPARIDHVSTKTSLIFCVFAVS